jgi:hypothetical protein
MMIIPLFLLGLTIPQGLVQAVPLLPSSFYGTILLNGAPIPDGSLVQALVDGQVVAYTHSLTYQGASVYALNVPSSDPATSTPGGEAGDTIQFKIAGILAAQTGTWQSGTNVELNLTVISTLTPLPPQPTATSVPSPTATRVLLPSATALSTWTVVPPTLASPAASNTLELAQVSATPASTLQDPTAASPAADQNLNIATSLPEEIAAAETGNPSLRKAQNLAIGIVVLAALTGLGFLVHRRVSKQENGSVH